MALTSRLHGSHHIMERSPIHVAWIALALCAGCTPDRPYVPRRELAERILEPPTLAPLPAEQVSPASESDRKYNGDDHSEQPENSAAAIGP
jgi:hypothetical protein